MNTPQIPISEAARHALPSALIHDLRTPLNQIIGYSELLMEQAQEQGQAHFVPDLQKTQTAGRQLLAIINDHFHSLCVPGTPETIAPSREEHANPAEVEQNAEVIAEYPRAGEPASDTAQGYVLVVDDVEANRDVLSRRLQRQGYAVATADDGRQALEKLSAYTFDLVLLDIMMPEMDGYEVLQHIKADKVLRHIPVIMISALNELDSVVRCIGMGAEDYLPKPFNPTLLKARIGACLEKKRARDRERHLFAELEARNTEMARWRVAQEADLAIARSTQQSIVTAALPQFEGWKVEAVYTPLIQVGGDVYGWRQLDHGVWLFWLADATGHGVAAALFTTLVALLFNHASSSSNTAHGILIRVNAEFYEVLRGRSFLTACCAIIRSDGRLSFAGAGHPPLLIRRHDGVVEALPSLNTVMGIEPEMKISDTETTLASGDVALLYTDGLSSLKSKAGGRFTTKTITDAFARIDGSMDVLPRLIEELIQQSGAQPFDDDLAAITLRRG